MKWTIRVKSKWTVGVTRVRKPYHRTESHTITRHWQWLRATRCTICGTGFRQSNRIVLPKLIQNTSPAASQEEIGIQLLVEKYCHDIVQELGVTTARTSFSFVTLAAIEFV